MKAEHESLVLLVEDSEHDAYFFKRSLKKSGASCAICHLTNGTEALDYLKEAESQGRPLPLAIFLDLKMPLLNGFEVLEWYREQQFLKDVPVYVLSGSDHQEDQKRAKALGAARYLVKPAQADDLRTILGAICSKASQERSAGA